MNDTVVIYEWPDGTWCEEDELEEHLAWMSDDFRRIVLTYDEYEKFVITGERV